MRAVRAGAPPERRHQRGGTMCDKNSKARGCRAAGVPSEAEATATAAERHKGQ